MSIKFGHNRFTATRFTVRVQLVQHNKQALAQQLAVTTKTSMMCMLHEEERV